MAQKIPQYSDITLQYNDIQDSSGNPIDLTTVDDIECVICQGKISQVPLVKLIKSISPNNFVISGLNNGSVGVKVAAFQLNNSTGIFFTNLWVTMGGKHITNLTNNFIIVSAIPY